MAAVVVAAGLFGWWLARRITRRLVVLTSAAEDVARTRQLGIQVPVAGLDEVGRLGRAFDRMLGRLAQSEEDQRRLVQDAGHELRTPLTSLRTNISLLRRIDELPPATREELVADLSQEARELTDLVNELVDLAAGQSENEPPQRVDLADLAEDVVGLARRRTGRDVVLRVSGDTTTDGRPGMLQRAISNLVENAAKFDRDGKAPIEVSITGPARPGTVRVEVRDRGPGIAEGDLVRIFDRFYRAADARSQPGSGLGLSIVREVAMAHGGAPFAFRREGRRGHRVHGRGAGSCRAATPGSDGGRAGARSVVASAAGRRQVPGQVAHRCPGGHRGGDHPAGRQAVAEQVRAPVQAVQAEAAQLVHADGGDDQADDQHGQRRRETARAVLRARLRFRGVVHGSPVEQTCERPGEHGRLGTYNT